MTTAKKPKFSRILLKLSGESLGDTNGMGISPEAVHHMAGQIQEESNNSACRLSWSCWRAEIFFAG